MVNRKITLQTEKGGKIQSYKNTEGQVHKSEIKGITQMLIHPHTIVIFSYRGETVSRSSFCPLFTLKCLAWSRCSIFTKLSERDS